MGFFITFPPSLVVTVSYEKVGGIAGLLFFVSFALVNIILPQVITGSSRVSGTSDISSIFAYYNHPALGGTFWGAFDLLLFLLFVPAIYLSFRSDAKSAGVSLFLLAGTLTAVIEAPLLMSVSALQWTLVSIAGQHAIAADIATRTALESSGLAIFKLWDFLYNSLTYWIEGGYLLFFSITIVKTRVFAHWVGWLGLAGAALLFFNTLAVPLGIPDALTLIGNVVLVAWLVSVSISLLRTKSDVVKSE